MIPESEMSCEDMKKTAETHTCGECGSLLTVAWGGAFGVNSYILRCSKDIKHSTINGHNKAIEEATKQKREVYKLDSKSLMVMTEPQMLQRVKMAKFPQTLQPDEERLLAQVAITYGFDPLMGEVTVYQGRPYVSIDGRYRKAQETGLFDGIESRPATKQERAEWGIPEGDYFFRAEVSVKGASKPFVGWGRVYGSETLNGKGYKPVEKNPQRMAEKRAEAQALRKAFHIPLPSAEEAGSPTDEHPDAIHGKVIKVETISQSSADKEFDQMGKDRDALDEKERQSTEVDLVALTFKNQGEFYTACLKHFKLQKSDVNKEVPEYNLDDAGQRKKAWEYIVGVHGQQPK